MVEVTWEMNGKMEGMCSISTSVLSNPFCKRNAKIKGSICSHCYSQTMAKAYKFLDDKNQRNTELLTARVLSKEELPDVDPEKYPWGRLEAFGDLHNEIQLDNYMNIVKKNNKTNWALYTKRYDLVFDYFDTHDVPENFTLVLSSLLVNESLKDSWVDEFEKKGFRKGQLKVFTVYDKKYIKEHPELVINCGARNCFKCHRCYDRRDERHVGEILKSDSEAATLLIGLRDEKKVESILNRLKRK